MQNFVHIVLILSIIISASMAIRFRDLLFAVISLSLASASLALLFYQMGASTAAIFELSVGAGLVAVLFISAISLTQSGREEDVSEE